MIAGVAGAKIVGGSSIDQDVSYHLDVRGVKLLLCLDFWQLFSIMAILAGTGLMTIKYVLYIFLANLLSTKLTFCKVILEMMQTPSGSIMTPQLMNRSSLATSKYTFPFSLFSIL